MLEISQAQLHTMKYQQSSRDYHCSLLRVKYTHLSCTDVLSERHEFEHKSIEDPLILHIQPESILL